jgi:hypothetical protein
VYVLCERALGVWSELSDAGAHGGNPNGLCDTGMACFVNAAEEAAGTVERCCYIYKGLFFCSSHSLCVSSAIALARSPLGRSSAIEILWDSLRAAISRDAEPCARSLTVIAQHSARTTALAVRICTLWHKFRNLEPKPVNSNLCPSIQAILRFTIAKTLPPSSGAGRPKAA